MADPGAGDDEGPKQLGSYEMGKVLGAGAFSKVKLGTHMTSGLQVAVKIVDKEMIQNIKDLERVMREMHVLKNIVHPNIIRLHEVMEKGARLFLVLDFAGGGELYDYVMDKGPLPEKQARTFFGQILSGVDFFHRQHVSHRDMKPENVLLVDSGNGSLVCKIADFGLSNDMLPGLQLKTICGTPAYAAPEITLGQKYDGIAVDIWSTGVILFFLVAGQIPFDCESQSELFKKIQNAQFTIPSHCSPELSDLIRRFMDVSPQKRITTAQAWLHPWLSLLNNRFLDLDLDVDDALEEDQEMDKEPAAEGEKSVGDAGAGGRMVNGVSFPQMTLELLGNPSHLPPSGTESAVVDTNGVSFLLVALSPATKDGASSASAAADEAGPKKMSLCWVPKKKEDAVGSEVSPARGEKKTEADAKGKGVAIPGAKAASSPTRTAGRTLGTSPVLDTAGRSNARRRSLEVPKQSPEQAVGRAASTNSPGQAVPSIAGDLCCVTSKDPKAVMRDLQRLFSDYKVSLRCLNATSIKGEKTRVRFELSILKVETLGTAVPASDLFVVSASRISGDSVTCRDVCRRLLLKL